MNANALPAHFSSTANALEELAFTVKDALLVVDDFVPAGGPADGELHGTAERLFRAAGNHQGRSRMSGYGRLTEGRPPRSLLLATGEAVPRGQSLRARLLIVEVRPAEVEVFRRLQHGFDLFASGAGLQFPREFSPHIKDVDDGAVVSEQLAVRLLQGRDTEVHQSLNDSVSVR